MSVEIPLWIVGVIYLVGLAIALIFFLFNLYHLKRFGYFDFTAYVVTILAVSAITIVILFSAIFLSRVDWTSSAPLITANPLSDITDQLWAVNINLPFQDNATMSMLC